MKRQSTEYKKTFSNNISEKGLIFKTHKEHLQFNNKETNKKLQLKNRQRI